MAGIRLRQAGVAVGGFPVGATNSIVDVRGVRVGHRTVSDGRATFSGATAIVVDGASSATPVRAGMFVGNGYGKFVGATQIAELGQVETPIVLTSTLSAFRAADAVVTWVLRRHGRAVTSVNPVVGEVNDSWLSTAEPRPVTAEHVLEAIDGASTEAVPMGNVGGGTGACALGFKGGIGSSSRVVDLGGGAATGEAATGEVAIGALAQINMGGSLRALGRTVLPADHGLPAAGPRADGGSCVIVIAVDAPFDANLLRRLASRAVYALARVGARFSHGSGDYALAVSTSEAGRPTVALTNHQTSAAFEAAMDAVEEAVLDALLAATTVRSTGGRVAHALPVESIAGVSGPGLPGPGLPGPGFSGPGLPGSESPERP
ncbi:P1 family peptidase [Streptomyces sp. TS71-3]|uniref:P1 family peptidase n=1 Tax=Streptomyces sp. TS71-3 TaxID=2733862 RepID=UPI00201764EA|nr:P1 family peptidase [Streptomyces sp. TS71-3]